MKADIAKLWAEELRSGKWTQGKDSLAENGRHCCLGVLCEIASKAISVPSNVNLGRTTFAGKSYVVPILIQKWSGLVSSCGNLPNGESLSVLNDAGKTFSEIAGIIEKHAAYL